VKSPVGPVVALLLTGISVPGVESPVEVPTLWVKVRHKSIKLHL